MKIISNIRVGRPDTTPDKSAHTRGVREGNECGSFDREPGFYRDGKMGKATARRSTGINPDSMNPMDPNIPNLSPA
jgi:hypothetical protein